MKILNLDNIMHWIYSSNFPFHKILTDSPGSEKSTNFQKKLRRSIGYKFLFCNILYLPAALAHQFAALLKKSRSFLIDRLISPPLLVIETDLIV